MKKLSKIFSVVAMLTFAATTVGCGAVSDKIEETQNKKFEASNSIVKSNPEVKKELKKPVTSEEEMVAVLSEVVEETMTEVLKIGLFGDRAAAKDAKSAGEQAKAFVDELAKQLEKAAETGKTEIDFDKSIDIEALSVKDALQIAVDIYNANRPEDAEELKLDDVLKGYGIENIVTALDDFAALDKFKLSLDLLISDSKKKASVDESVMVAASVGDVNRLVTKILNSKKEITAVPVKGVSVSVKEKVGALVTGENYTKTFGDEEKEETLEISCDKLSVSTDAQVALAILTGSKAGGYFDVDAKVDLDVDKVNKLLEASEKDDLDGLVKLLDSMVTVKISVSNGSKTTYSQVYNYESIMKLFNDAFGGYLDSILGLF